MRALVFFTVLVVCAQGSNTTKFAQKLIPSFTSNFVINGHEAVPYSAPFIVSLSKRGSKHFHICGGTIINHDWILTAAHCIRKPEDISVYAGLHDQLKIDNNTQHRTVDWGKVHEGYTGGVGPFDIALLHLSVPLKFNKHVQPAILPGTEEIHNGKTHLYGWGQTKPYSFAGAKILQTVETEIIPYDNCTAALPETAPIHTTNICSDSLQKGISACNGDSGGPLVIYREGVRHELIGIVSWGYVPCGVRHMPSIYTRVSAHIDWINRNKYIYHHLPR